jgi:Zn-dependent alcohol dehydrogenase
VSFFESVVRDHSKDPPGGRAYVGGTRSLRSVVHHSAGLHFADGRLDVSATITDRISLADVPAAFERMQRGEGGRALVVFPSL